jgi:hypothetical protein
MLVFATEGRFFYDFLPPLLVADHLYAVDEAMTTVPLVLMAQDRLQVVPVRGVQIAGYSHTQPLVTLLAPEVSETPPNSSECHYGGKVRCSLGNRSA